MAFFGYFVSKDLDNKIKFAFNCGYGKLCFC